MIRIWINNGDGDVDYTIFVGNGSIHIEDRVNQPTLCSFVLSNIKDSFKEPLKDAYVRIYSHNNEKHLFTGFITDVPIKKFLGVNANTPSTGFQQYEYTINCTSDEYLLNIKAVAFLPAFVNRGRGEILASIANTLAPNFFDVTSFVVSGDRIPYYIYDPKKTWYQIAKELSDQARYRYKFLNKVLYFQRFGDQPLGISYDETQPQGAFYPYTLTTDVLSNPLVNDAIVIGDFEAGTIHEDYFIGDGFQANFPLRHKVWESTSSLLLQDDWTQTSFSQNWTVSDPLLNFALIGALNCVGGPQAENISSIQAKNAVELGGIIDFQNGEFLFNDTCTGTIGGVYDDPGNIFQSQCEFGFDVRPSTLGVLATASGASGIQITPMRQGVLLASGFQIVTQVNHHYQLRILVQASRATRYTQVFRTILEVPYGGTTNSGTVDITWIVEDINLNFNASGPPTESKFTLKNVSVPAIGFYALLNNVNLNLTINFTQLSFPVQASLSVISLTGASGSQLPLPTSQLGPELGYALGYGLSGQTATVSDAGDSSQLQFYSDTIPGVGARIKIKSWESQAAIARVRDSSNIANEASLVGDDGIRLSVLTNLVPLPRSSEECELAARAAIADRETPLYQGTYSVHDYFLTRGFQDYPRPGEYLSVNAPFRGITTQKFIVNTVRTQILTLMEETLQFTLEFGSDTFLQKLLSRFSITQLRHNPSLSLLLPKDTGKQPTPIEISQVGNAYLDDLVNATVTGFIGSSSVTFDVGVVPASAVEVRYSDTGWGVNSLNLIGTFTTQQITVTRQQREQIWFLRMKNGGTFSRRSKALRINYPLLPTAPTLISADSHIVQIDFSGDIRNIRGWIFQGFALQAPIQGGGLGGGGYIAVTLGQKTITTPKDMLIDIPSLLQSFLGSYTGPPLQLPLVMLRTGFTTSFFNLIDEFGPAIAILDTTPPAPVLSLGYSFSHDVEVKMDFLANRSDIVSTVVQIAEDVNFSVNVISVTGNGQPPNVHFNVLNSVPLFVQAMRVDNIGGGPWSATLNIPAGNLIASSWANGQGSLLPILDTNVSQMFNAVATANAPGGANTGEIVISWQAFNILFPDQSTQPVAAGSFDTGTTLTTAQGSSTPYYFYPRIQAKIPGAIPQFVNGAHPNKNTADAASTFTDGYFALGGASLGFVINIPAAPASGPPAGGGGGGGGGQCVDANATVRTSDGLVKMRDLKVNTLIKAGDPFTMKEKWVVVHKICLAEEFCYEIILLSGKKVRLSKSAPNAVALWNGKEFTITEMSCRDLTVGMHMLCEDTLAWDKIISIEDVGDIEVVRLFLRPSHWFFANGILVHNSIEEIK